MTARLTYLGFHAAFLVPPLVVLAVAVFRRRGRLTASEWRARGVGFVILALVALVYTAPWDNYLIERGVWWYGEGTVVATVWLAPVEEYLFMLLQPLVVVLWLALLATTAAAATSTSGSGSTPAPAPTVSVSGRQRLAGVVAGGLVLAAGLALLGGARTYYLGAILAWAGPVLALQWGFGWPYLWASRRTLVLGTGVPTVYLWVADWAAIDLGIWVISETYTTGVTLVGLPVEEAAFFLVTTLFVVQGLVLFLWVVERWGWTTASPEAARDERSRPVEGWSDDPAAGVVAHSHRVASSERTDGGREPRGPHERQ